MSRWGKNNRILRKKLTLIQIGEAVTIGTGYIELVGILTRQLIFEENKITRKWLNE